jgi:hypothetical protein
MSFCTQCGSSLHAGSGFCADCGAPLEDPQQALAAQTVPMPQSNHAVLTKPATSETAASDGPPISQSHLRIGQLTHLGIGQLSPAQTTAAAKDGLAALASLVGLLFALVGVLAAVFAPSDHHGSPADWFHSAVILLGLGVHAPVDVHLMGGAVGSTPSVAEATVTLAITLTPLIITGLVILAGLLAGRHSERHLPSASLREVLGLSLLTGVVFAAAAAVLAFISSSRLGYGVTDVSLDSILAIRLGSNPWLVLVGSAVVVAPSAFLGRFCAFARSRGASPAQLAAVRLGVWMEDLRSARNLMLGSALVTVISLACAGVWVAVRASSSADLGVAAGSDGGSGAGAKEVAAVVIGGALMLPNMLVDAVGFALGGTLGVSGSGDARTGLLDSGSFARQLATGVGLFSGGVPGSYYLVWLPMLVVVLAVGVRATLKRPPGQPVGPHMWRTMAVFAGLWAALALWTHSNGQLSGSTAALSLAGVAQGQVGGGLDALSLIGSAALWTALSVFGGALVTRRAAAVLPRAVVRLGGRQTHWEWQLLLAAATLERGATIPPRLAAAAAALSSGSRAQAPALDVRLRGDRVLVAGGLALFIIVIGATVGYQTAAEKTFSPGVVVGDYFGALRAGDVSGALALVDSRSSKGLDKSLLTSGSLSGVPTDVRVTATRVTGDTASVTVTEKIAGTQSEASFSLTREGRSAVLFDRWRLTSPFTVLAISADGVSDTFAMTVNGTPSTPGNHPVFPGSYTVALPASGLYESVDAQVDATGDGSQDAALVPTVDPRVQDAGDQAVHTFLDACASSVDAVPAGCPFSYSNSSYSSIDYVHWVITAYPSFSFTVEADGTISASMDAPGTASISAVGTDYFSSSVSPIADTAAIEGLSGTLVWDGGDLAGASFYSD